MCVEISLFLWRSLKIKYILQKLIVIFFCQNKSKVTLPEVRRFHRHHRRHLQLLPPGGTGDYSRGPERCVHFPPLASRSRFYSLPSQYCHLQSKTKKENYRKLSTYYSDPQNDKLKMIKIYSIYTFTGKKPVFCLFIKDS